MLRLANHAHPVLTDGGGAILNERTGRWTQLTPTAAAAVMILCATLTEDEAAAQYATRYQLTREQAASDIRHVRTALAAAGLTRPKEPTGRRRRVWRWWR